jgi:RNA polymerase sigma-70 factor (ECF subfamily)
MDSTDNAWIQKAVDRYERPLILYASRLMGDGSGALDVVQETFLRLCRQSPAELDGHLAQWLFTVCRNRALEIRRKESRMQVTAQIEPATTGALSGRPDVEQQETSQQIMKLMASLPENQQEVLRLKFQGGLSYREISSATQLSVSNVGYLLHTALATLRRQLTAEGAGP